ncbi:hypothetical protein HPP92_008043 [Vanilla planifolia]|uniref:Uncharacterized protein n=1 Tax=Vanilla planifolia TaxID=51239 RepID=A0A835V8D1_VANPL|nr:hypothetical protein HPP92_008043 [Vanilla planifolia]
MDKEGGWIKALGVPLLLNKAAALGPAGGGMADVEVKAEFLMVDEGMIIVSTAVEQQGSDVLLAVIASLMQDSVVEANKDVEREQSPKLCDQAARANSPKSFLEILHAGNSVSIGCREAAMLEWRLLVVPSLQGHGLICRCF